MRASNVRSDAHGDRKAPDTGSTPTIHHVGRDARTSHALALRTVGGFGGPRSRRGRAWCVPFPQGKQAYDGARRGGRSNGLSAAAAAPAASLKQDHLLIYDAALS